MLLIDDDQPEFGKGEFRLHDCLGTDNDVNLAGGNLFGQTLAMRR